MGVVKRFWTSRDERLVSPMFGDNHSSTWKTPKMTASCHVNRLSHPLATSSRPQPGQQRLS